MCQWGVTNGHPPCHANPRVKTFPFHIAAKRLEIDDNANTARLKGQFLALK